MTQTLTEQMVKDAYEKYTSIFLLGDTKEALFMFNGDYCVKKPVVKHLTIQEFAHMLGMDKRFMKYWFGFKLKGQ